MKKKPVNISASVLARLKNMADKEHLDFNFLLLRYMQERFLSRLVASGYINRFVLKGGVLLLAYNIERARPTRISTSWASIFLVIARILNALSGKSSPSTLTTA